MVCVCFESTQRLMLSVIIAVATVCSPTASLGLPHNASTSYPKSDHVMKDADVTFSPSALVADVDHDFRRSVYILQLSVGHNSSSGIVIEDHSVNGTELLLEFRNFLKSATSGVYLQSNKVNGTDSKYTLALEFSHAALGMHTQSSVTEALDRLKTSNMVRVDFNITAVLADFLASTHDPCSAHNVCPLGFTCNTLGCRHMCHQENVCSGHGDCTVGVSASAHVSLSCRCHSGYFNHYSGDQCQNSRMGDGQVIAVIAGVLGSICLLLVITLACLCASRKSKSSYMLSREVYSNSTYEHAAAKG